MVQCGVVEDRGLLEEVEELSHGYRDSEPDESRMS
jgi:hypothetical protein